MKKLFFVFAVLITNLYSHGNFSLRHFRNNFDEKFPGCKVFIYGVYDTPQVLDSIKVVISEETVKIVKEEMGRTDDELIYNFKQDVFGTTFLAFGDCEIYSNPSLIEDHFNPAAQVILIINGVKRTYVQLSDWIRIYIELLDLTSKSGTTARTDKEKAEFRRNIENAWR